MELTLGEKIPLTAELTFNETDKYIRAYLLDHNGNEIQEVSPVDLTHKAYGFYDNETIPMPNIPTVKAIYFVYDDPEYLQLSNIYGAGLDVFKLKTASSEETIKGVINDTDSITGVVFDSNNIEGIIDECD